MPRWALGLEYDGRGFCGWQSQPGECAVQDAVERALRGIAGHALRVCPLGRTDAGVHARHQVVHFDTTVERPESAWVRGSNGRLPAGVSVLWAKAMPASFHARACALGRHYQYVLQNTPVRPALDAGRVGWFHRPLDLAAMRQAAQYLCGRHDFSSFRAAQCQAPTPIRDLRRLDIQRRGEYLVFWFSADAFLHHMVRNLLGALVEVGCKRREPQWVGEILQARNRALGAPTFSPAGLYLIGGDYSPAWGLPRALRPVPWTGQTGNHPAAEQVDGLGMGLECCEEHESRFAD